MAGAIIAACVVIAVVVYVVIARRPRQNKSPASASATQGEAGDNILQTNNPTFVGALRVSGAQQWMLSLEGSGENGALPGVYASAGEEEVLPGAYAETGAPAEYGEPAQLSSKATAAGAAPTYATIPDDGAGQYQRLLGMYAKIEAAGGPARYEVPVVLRSAQAEQARRLRGVEVEPGYTALSADHKRDVDAHVPDDRLRSGDAVPRGRRATVFEPPAGYTSLDGTQRLYASGGGREQQLRGYAAGAADEDV